MGVISSLSTIAFFKHFFPRFSPFIFCTIFCNSFPHFCRRFLNFNVKIILITKFTRGRLRWLISSHFWEENWPKIKPIANGIFQFSFNFQVHIQNLLYSKRKFIFINNEEFESNLSSPPFSIFFVVVSILRGVP